MKAKVTEQGLLIPKKLLNGIEEVEIRKEQNVLLIVPILENDAILQLGRQPVRDEIDDGSTRHDHYLYNL